MAGKLSKKQAMATLKNATKHKRGLQGYNTQEIQSQIEKDLNKKGFSQDKAKKEARTMIDNMNYIIKN